MVSKMTKEEFIKRIVANGWKYEESSLQGKCQCGDIIIYLKSDEEYNFYLQLPDKEIGYLNSIVDISFTPFRMLIQWETYQEWYLIY